MRLLVPLLAGLLAGGAVYVVTAGGEEERAPARAAAAEADGRAVFAQMGCGGCHTLADAEARGGIGPDLDRALPAYDRASLTRQITDPRGSRGFEAMPEDFEERMSAEELSALVTYLLETAG